MKHVLMLIAVLTMAIPSLASVAITCTDEGSGVIAVRYNNTETGNVRAFALDITVSGGATITSPSEWNASYNVCPGSYVSSTNLGSPICNGSKYPGTLAGLGTAGVTIEMGSLYAPGNPAPAKSGILGKLTVGCGVTVTVAANTIRGGAVIMEDPTLTPTVTMSGVTTGSCEPELCLGDIDGDGWLSPDDVGMMLVTLDPYAGDGYWVEIGSHTEWLAGDVDQDGWLSPDDVGALLVTLDPYAGAGYWVECGSF